MIQNKYSKCVLLPGCTVDFSTLEEDPTDVTQFSKEQLLQLQSNFRALQRKFISLMSEKAELLERIQEHEHVIVQLSVETETIGVCMRERGERS